ncbi:MAG: ABC transporter substrate-binding protein [Candidatus Nanopelagicales bacterium]
MKMTRLTAIAAAAVLALVAACGGGGGTAREADPSSIKINGDYVVPPSAHGNPFTAGYIGGGLEPYLQDSLFAFTPYGDVRFKPHLAQSYEIDGSSIEVTLRDGIKWDDGTAITAQDVLTSYEMWTGKKQIWEFLDSIDITGERTLKFEFKVGSDLMMNLLRDVPVAATAKEYGKWAKKYQKLLATEREWHPETGTFWFSEAASKELADINTSLQKHQPNVLKTPKSGAFTLQALTTGEAVLTQNKNFYNDTGIARLTVVRAITSEVAANAMVDGTLDVHSGGMTEDLINQVRNRIEGYTEFYLPEYSQMSVVFNVNKPFAKDLAFRQAMGFLMNQELMLPLAEVGSLPAERTSTGLPPSLQTTYGLAEYAATLPQREYNLDKATEILTAGGYKQGADGSWTNADGKRVSFTFVCNNGWGSALLPSEAFVNDLRTFGFDVTFRPMEGAAYDAFLRAGDHTVGVEFAPPSNIIYAHPYGTYEQLFRGRAWLFGLTPDDKGAINLPDATGKMVDVVGLTKSLFTATGDAATEITKQLMAVSNHNVLFIPYLEKGFPVRTLRTNLDFGVEDGALVQDPRFSGVAETMFATLIAEGNLKAAIS